MAQTPVTSNDSEGHFTCSYLTLLTHFLGNMTRINFYVRILYENRRAYVASNNELGGHSSISELFKCKSSTFCEERYKRSTGIPASRGPSSTAGLLVFSSVLVSRNRHLSVEIWAWHEWDTTQVNHFAVVWIYLCRLCTIISSIYKAFTKIHPWSWM